MTAAAASPALVVENVDLFYGDAQALSGVSLEVPRGAIVAIVGANGAGKSSLIHTIAGLEVARSGRIVFDGREIQALESHEICNLGIGQVAEGAPAAIQAHPEVIRAYLGGSAGPA